MACSYETWRPIVDMQIPAGMQAKPCKKHIQNIEIHYKNVSSPHHFKCAIDHGKSNSPRGWLINVQGNSNRPPKLPFPSRFYFFMWQAWGYKDRKRTPLRSFTSTVMIYYYIFAKKGSSVKEKQGNLHIGSTCCIIFENSENNTFRPDSSNILSKVISCKATRVVSNMSSPAWFANTKTGCACTNRKG